MANYSVTLSCALSILQLDLCISVDLLALVLNCNDNYLFKCRLSIAILHCLDMIQSNPIRKIMTP